MTPQQVHTLDENSTGLTLGTADFQHSPPTLTNVTLVALGGVFAGDHQRLGNSNTVTIQFNLSTDTFMRTIVARVFGLVSRDGDKDGFAPVTVTLNGFTLASRATVGAAGFGPENARFVMPPAYLVPGANTLSIQVAGDSRTFFWLYQLGVDFSPAPYPGETATVSLRTNPPAVDPSLVVTANTGEFQDDHWRYAPAKTFALTFTLPDVNSRNDAVNLAVVGLVSRDGSQQGFSPVTLAVNGQTIVDRYTIGGAGFGPERVVFAVPAESSVAGANTVTLTIAGDARTFFWLYAVEVIHSEFYQKLGVADFSVSPPRSQNLSVVSAQGVFSNDHWAMNHDQSVVVSFSSLIPMLVVFEFEGLMSRSEPNEGYAPITITLNGTWLIADFLTPGGGFGYQECAFLSPPQVLQQGNNEFSIRVAQNNRTLFWLRTIRVRAMYNGPAVRRELATASSSYRSYGNLSNVPLMFLLRRPASALGVVNGIVQLAGSGTIDVAIGVLNSAASDMTWFQSQVAAVFGRGERVNLAGIFIAPHTDSAQNLLAYLAFAVGRCTQEARRLDCIKRNAPLDFEYTFGLDVSAAIQARLAQVTAVSAVGGKYRFTDQQTGAGYNFDTMDIATAKRADYCVYLKAGILEAALASTQDAAQKLVALYDPTPAAVPILAALFVAAVAVSAYNIYAGYQRTKNSSTAREGGNFPMNWHGYMTDWEMMVSYDWFNVPTIGYLKSGGVMSVCVSPGKREDKSLDDPTKGFGGYYNYVYIANSDHPIRLSPKNPSLSPPGEIFHSQLAGGKDVDCAGELQFANGKFRFVNTLSGHFYKTVPDWHACRAQFLQAVAAMGYDISALGDGLYTGEDLDLLQSEL